MDASIKKLVQKIVLLRIGPFHLPWIHHKGMRHQIFNFKTAAKSEMSSPIQTQLEHNDLEILIQMGHALDKRYKIRNCINKSDNLNEDDINGSAAVSEITFQSYSYGSVAYYEIFQLINICQNNAVNCKKTVRSKKNFISANQNDEVQNEAHKESRNHGLQQRPST